MTVETFALPDVGEGVTEGELLRWLVEPGDEVGTDQPLAEVETDKAVVDLPSPYEGTVVELHAEEGELVPVGSVVVSIETSDDGDATGGPEEGGDGPASAADRRAVAPPRTRRLARELGVDLERVSGSRPGGRVTDADVRDAAEGSDDATGHRESSETVERAAAVDGERSTRDRTLAAPATRRLADDLGVDLDAVPTDERRDGVAVVTAELVREYAASERDDGSEADGETGTTASTPAADPSPGDRIPYRGIRRTIGERMVESTARVAHVTHTDEVDVTRLVETKAELEPYAAEEGVELTYLPFVMRAVAGALAEFPRVNASLDEEREEIRCHETYDIGVATATEAGLLVPVIEDVDRKGLLDLAAETASKVERARDRRIDRVEMQGGTFTVTNVGVIGGRYATPIVNHPEVAILALGRIEEQPRVVDGEVVARHTLPLSLSVDHRVVDGAVAARFTNRVMELLAAPARLLVD
ncbi:dihydrolipoamide acetyltransferase family protein [Haloplanus salilacus]|uniref:dihydrolipoamide acetyltransferase family protein n=1 Tax=Haloplanus salilacus TaxID=2949994 RepID=UPI0030CC643B